MLVNSITSQSNNNIPNSRDARFVRPLGRKTEKIRAFRGFRERKDIRKKNDEQQNLEQRSVLVPLEYLAKHRVAIKSVQIRRAILHSKRANFVISKAFT